MHCRFSDQAEDDLDGICDFIAQDNPTRALSFVDEIRAHCRKLVHAPNRAIVDWMDDLPVRKAVHGDYIIYFVWLEDQDTVFIVHIRHSARLTPNFQS